ncbi:MAG: signal peptidase II [Flavobacteriaceae bacterium]|nr:signal peptidase II [Flavobacteriaceae bacterium]
MRFSKRSIFIVVLVVVTIALDQISKFWVRASVEPFSKSEILGKYFTLHNVENTGAFLGLGSDFNPTLKFILLLLLPVLVLGFVLYQVFTEKNMDKFSFVGFCFIIGGGIANVYDRFVYGSVTDFFHIDLGGSLKTGIFNIADVSVTSGMIMLLLGAIIKWRTSKKSLD